LCDIQLIQQPVIMSVSEADGGATPCTQIVNEDLVQEIVDILSNRYYKLGSFPLNSNVDFPSRFVALKTGTSRNFSDTRAMGFTRRYIIGIRVGNKDGSNMEGISGVDGAGYLFKQIVELLEPTETLDQPPLMQKQSQEYVQITSPLNGSVFKYDPTIPQTAQKI
jgi:membrane carboxypeptidase/penicillin-binding protein PbpC